MFWADSWLCTDGLHSCWVVRQQAGVVHTSQLGLSSPSSCMPSSQPPAPILALRAQLLQTRGSVLAAPQGSCTSLTSRLPPPPKPASLLSPPCPPTCYPPCLLARSPFPEITYSRRKWASGSGHLGWVFIHWPNAPGQETQPH